MSRKTLSISEETYVILLNYKLKRSLKNGQQFSFDEVLRKLVEIAEKSGTGVRGVEHVWTDEEFAEHFKWLEEERKKREREK